MRLKSFQEAKSYCENILRQSLVAYNYVQEAFKILEKTFRGASLICSSMWFDFAPNLSLHKCCWFLLNLLLSTSENLFYSVYKIRAVIKPNEWRLASSSDEHLDSQDKWTQIEEINNFNMNSSRCEASKQKHHVF